MATDLYVFIIFSIPLVAHTVLGEQSRSDAEEQAVYLYNYEAKNGHYTALTIVGISDFILSLKCDPGYAPNVFHPEVLCLKGVCPKPLPECVRQCQLNKQLSLSYYCPNSWDSKRECEDAVLSGTTVITECKDRNYFSPHDFKCVDGEWDRSPICKPECGKVTYESAYLTPIGDRALYNLAPWHATVYSKLTRSPVCGGTIVSATVIISAARCFWDSAVGLLPPTYRVVVGTLYQNSFYGLDMYRQQQDVNDIKLPNQFDGTPNTLEFDIAMVTVAAPLQFSAFVTPACLDFDPNFNEQQLSENMLGKFASRDEATGELKPQNLPILPAANCAESHFRSQQMITMNNQICAGVTNGTTQDKITTGTGLVFGNTHHGVERFYLRGVASIINENGTSIMFTQITKHQKFMTS